MIRRSVGALLVLALTVTYAPPVQAQPPTPAKRSDSPLFWAILGAAAGAVVAGLGVYGPYDDTWSSERKLLTVTATGAAVGEGISFALSRWRARAARGLYFVSVAEGLTSATLTEGIRVAPRGFTASQLVEACKDPRVVERLEVAPNLLDLREDGRYALNSLSVVAVNAADVAMAGVPIVLEAEEANPPVIQLRSDDPVLNAGRLHALRTGAFQMRVRTMCGTPHAEAVIRGRVSSP